MLKKPYFFILLGVIVLGTLSKDVRAGDDCQRLGQPCQCSNGSKANCVPAPASDLSFRNFKCPCENSK